MLGALAGNIAGSPYLWNHPEDLSQVDNLFDPPAHLTETGRLLLEFSHQLLEQPADPAALSAELRAKGYPAIGLAESCLIGLAAESDEAVMELISALSPDQASDLCAVGLTCRWARRGETKETMLDRIESDYFPVFRQGLEIDRPAVRLIAGFISSHDFISALERAIEYARPGEDLASAMGALAAAYYGLGDDLIRLIRRLVSNSGRNTIRRWHSRYPLFDPQDYRLLTKYRGRLSDSREVGQFVREFYFFAIDYTPADLSRYQEILLAAGLEWTEKTLRETDGKHHTATTLLALIMGSLRADYFSPGLLSQLIAAGVVDQWLECLAELAEEQEKQPQPEVIRFHLQLHSQTGHDDIRLDETGLEITSHETGKLEQSMTFRLHDRWLIGQLDDILRHFGRLIVSDEWDGRPPENEVLTYRLEAELIDGQLWHKTGSYDRAHMPEADWRRLIEMLQEFTGRLGWGRGLSLAEFDAALKPGEVKYCGVEFDDYGKIYHYLTYDMTIKLGDRVIVPAGPANQEKEVTVRTIEFCHWDDTPYPLEETKLILRKADAPSDGPSGLAPPPQDDDWLPFSVGLIG